MMGVVFGLALQKVFALLMILLAEVGCVVGEEALERNRCGESACLVLGKDGWWGVGIAIRYWECLIQRRITRFLPGNTVRLAVGPAFGEIVVLDEGQLTDQIGRERTRVW